MNSFILKVVYEIGIIITHFTEKGNESPSH